MLEATLKYNWKNLVGEARYDEVLSDIKEKLRPDGPRYNELILLQSRYNNARAAGHFGQVDFQDQSKTFNSVADALLWFVDRIHFEDLSEAWQANCKDHFCLPEYHALTCDRVAQRDAFELYYYTDGQGKKVHKFYLYGDAAQAHESLHERLGRERGGQLLNWEKGNYEPGAKVLFKYLKPSVRSAPMLYKIEVIKSLLANFFDKINEKEPILQKNIGELLHSPELSGYGPEDMVFVLITMDDANWNKAVTPVFVRDFVSTFLAAGLPENAPQFFFFFGIEYTQGNSEKGAEVDAVIREHAATAPQEVLEELRSVGRADIVEWFSRYRRLMVDMDKNENQMVDQLFGNINHLDMEAVERILRERIIEHNKRLARINSKK